MSEESILPHPAVLIFFPLLLLRCSLSLNEQGGQSLVSCFWLSSEYLILRTVTSYAVLSWLLPTPKRVLARTGRDTRLQVYFFRLTRTSLMFLKMFILFLTLKVCPFLYKYDTFKLKFSFKNVIINSKEWVDSGKQQHKYWHKQHVIWPPAWNSFSRWAWRCQTKKTKHTKKISLCRGQLFSTVKVLLWGWRGEKAKNDNVLVTVPIVRRGVDNWEWLSIFVVIAWMRILKIYFNSF